MKSKLLLFALPVLLSSCNYLKQDGNLECRTIKNGANVSTTFSYDRSKEEIELISVSNSKEGSSVINESFKTTEINGIVRWKMVGDSITSFTFDKTNMRMEFTSNNPPIRNISACKWI